MGRLLACSMLLLSACATVLGSGKQNHWVSPGSSTVVVQGKYKHKVSMSAALSAAKLSPHLGAMVSKSKSGIKPERRRSHHSLTEWRRRPIWKLEGRASTPEPNRPNKSDSGAARSQRASDLEHPSKDSKLDTPQTGSFCHSTNHDEKDHIIPGHHRRPHSVIVEKIADLIGGP